MTYTAQGPARPSREELQARIPGWGADLDPANRPAFPQERYDPAATGAHWDFPDVQEPHGDREKSIEHGILPPVYGTSVPLKGLSGVVRRYAYARHSEAKAAHWLLLLAGDRLDAWESHLASFASTRPDNPFTETGVRAELRHGLQRRLGSKRVDSSHTWLDPIIVGGPWVLAGWGAVATGRRVLRRRGRRTAGARR